jgi:hypothetical protein
MRRVGHIGNEASARVAANHFDLEADDRFAGRTDDDHRHSGASKLAKLIGSSLGWIDFRPSGRFFAAAANDDGVRSGSEKQLFPVVTERE